MNNAEVANIIKNWKICPLKFCDIIDLAPYKPNFPGALTGSSVFIDEIATQLNTTFDEFISLMNEFENSDSSINETQSSNEEVNLTYNLLDRLCCKLTVLMTCNKFLFDIKLY